MCGGSVCERKFVCLNLCLFEPAIVILSTCAQVLSVLLIITTTSVRLTRGTFFFQTFIFYKMTSVNAFFTVRWNASYAFFYMIPCTLQKVIYTPRSPQIIRLVPIKKEILYCPPCVSSCELIVRHDTTSEAL